MNCHTARALPEKDHCGLKGWAIGHGPESELGLRVQLICRKQNRTPAQLMPGAKAQSDCWESVVAKKERKKKKSINAHIRDA